MIRIPDTPLDPVADAALRRFQSELDALPNYADRVSEAEKKFASRNRDSNKTFKAVRETLTAMCSGARRCMYCEDSAADEVEHVRPKQLYPEFTFVWENYVYACGPCNGGKRSRFEVFDGAGIRHDVARKPGAPVVPPVARNPLLLDPRVENPMDFLHLDLKGTFYFVPKPNLLARDRQRAEFTVEVLKLNAKAFLVDARKDAYHGLIDRLRSYISTRDRTPRSPKLQRTETSVKRTSHPTVWIEMKRQFAKINELRELFRSLPEALSW